jgi:hypothetical protein
MDWNIFFFNCRWVVTVIIQLQVGCNWFFPGYKWVATMFFCGCKSDFLVCKIVVFYYIDFFQFWNCEQSLFLLACSLFVCQIMVKIPSERTREIGLGKNVKREHMHTYFSVQKMDGSPQNNKEIRTLKHTLAGWLRFNKVSVAWDPVAPFKYRSGLWRGNPNIFAVEIYSIRFYFLPVVKGD